MATSNVIPPLPKGYTLDQPSAIPPLPTGYTLDSPQTSNVQTTPAELPWYKRKISEFKDAVSSPDKYIQSVKDNASQIPKFASAVGEDIKGALTSPGTYVGAPVSGGIDAIKQLYDAAKNGHFQAEPEFLDRLGGALGINTQGVRESAQQGDLAGAVGHAAVPLGTVAAAHGAGVPEMLPERPTARGVLAAKMAERPAGEPFTRQEVLDAARANGVNLDLAQATDSKVANVIKKAGEYSLGGGTTYEGNKTGNLDALQKWSETEAGKYSPQSTPREELGPQIQGKLQQDLATKKNAAQGSYQDLDSRIGSAPIDATSTVEAEARKIIAENKDYYSKHPELKPKQAWGILEDLAKRPVEKTMSKSPDVVLNSGESLTNMSSKEAGSNQMSWSELHQLRSDLMDFYRNNPDVVKGRGEAWIQRMVGKVDEAMTTGEKGLSGDDLEQFRHANGLWENIKSTYDNPSSPLYHAVRSQFPSQVPNMLAKQTPELANQVRKTLGSLEGPFQRQVVESLINDKAGTLDLKNLNSRLSRVPDDFLQSMLGEEGAKNLRLLGKVSQKITWDANPSGSAKTGIAAGEMVNLFLHPAAGAAEVGANFGAAKAMTSPKLIDFLSSPPKKGLAMKSGKR